MTTYWNIDEHAKQQKEACYDSIGLEREISFAD